MAAVPEREFTDALTELGDGAFFNGTQAMRILAVQWLMEHGQIDSARAVLALPTPVNPAKPLPVPAAEMTQ